MVRPSALDRNDLAGAISETAKALGLGGPGEPFFSLAADGVRTLPRPVEEAAFRIVAESLTNVAKHSGASRCQVRLAPEDGALHINVEDDGLGLREDGTQGVGLGSMRDRASRLGGHFEVGAVSPHGTLVHVEQLMRAVAEHEPDVVLTDLSMPTLDGVAATAMLRDATRPCRSSH